MTLSRKEKASVKCSFGTALELVEITREEFESVTLHLADETLDIVARAMEAARTKVPDLSYDEVLLVGGSSRMPMIERGLRERFGWSLTKTDYDLAVAKGAALYGQGIDRGVPVLAPGQQPSPAPRTFTIGADAIAKTITNVLPKGIGLKLVRDGAGSDDPEHYIGFLAHSQQPLPWEVLQTVETYSDNTTELTMHIFEQAGERESEVVADNKEITPETGATFTRLPALPKGSPIDVRLAIDSEGLSTLRAFEPKSGQELELTVRLAVLQAEDEEKAKELVQGVRLPTRAE